MKKIIFVGSQQVGKSTLTHILEETGKTAQKTIAPEYYANILDTPGEFLERPSFFGSLITLATDYKIVGVVVPANFQYVYLPPNFSSLFMDKKCIGIISKTDLGTEKDIERCMDLFKQAGITEVYKTSMHDKESTEELQKAIDAYATDSEGV